MPMRRALGALALTLIPLAACDSDDPAEPSQDGSATLSVLLTDAPGAVEAVWVEVLQVYFQGGGEGPLILLDESTGLIEITELVGTSATLVSDLEVEARSYGQLRMVLGGGVLETESGDVYTMNGATHPDGFEATGELMCPSCSQSGLKVIIPGDDVDVPEGDNVLVLDFDVAQSFGHKAGNSGKWVMRPTIHGTLVADEDGDGDAGDDLQGAGSIQGTVALGLDGESQPVVIPECPAGTARSIEDFIPVATAVNLVDGDGLAIARSGVVASDGAFAIGPLEADSWGLGYQETLEFEGGTLAFSATVDPAEVAVDGAPVTGVAYTITSATCQAAGG